MKTTAMKILLSDTVLAAAGDTRSEVELLVEELSQTDGIGLSKSVNGELDAIALSPRRGGLLLTLLDARERPIQMFPLRSEELQPHFELYARTIENLGCTDDLTSLRGFEALDYGKRVAHNEAGEAIRDLLSPVLTMDLETARQLFSLLFVLLAQASDEVRRNHRRHS